MPPSGCLTVALSIAPSDTSLLSGFDAAVAAALAVIAVGCLIWPLLWRRTLDPYCGHCGYGVRGMRNWECPECGKDLHEVGVITPAYRRRRRVLLLLGIWTACFAMMGALLYDYVKYELVPLQRVYEGRLSLREPTSGAYRLVRLESRVSYFDETPRTVTTALFGGDPEPKWYEDFELTHEMAVVLIDLEGDDHEYDINISVAPDRPSDMDKWDPGAVYPERLRLSIVRGWFDEAGIDTDDPRVKEEVAAVAQIFAPMPIRHRTHWAGDGVAEAASHYFGHSALGQWDERRYRPLVWAAVLSPIVVWLTGILWIRWRA